MTLNYVTLVLNLYDGGGNPETRGAAALVPSAVLTDASDQVIVTQDPVPGVFRSGSFPQVTLLATDNSGPQPTGWTWGITFSGQLAPPSPFSFFLPYTGGATQYLSSLIPVSSGTSFQAYMPLSGGQFTGPVTPGAVTLTDAATITVNAALGNLFRVTLGGNRTLAMEGGVDGQLVRVDVIQGPGGPWSLSYGSGFDFGAASPPVLSTATGARDTLGLAYTAASSKWDVLAFAAGY